MKTVNLLMLAVMILFWTGCHVNKNTSLASAGSIDDFHGKGAMMPFQTCQSQDADYKGQLLEFSTAYHQVQSEASGRKAVKLQNTGDYVRFTLKEAANAIVLRYCMPDGVEGGGISGALAVYADGEEAGSISLSSKYAWIYNYAGGWPGSNDPSAGEPCKFFDDSRMLFRNTFPEGTEITLVKEDAVEYYIIDMAEFEQVPAPLMQPENSLSISDYGAVSGGGDCRDALNTCVNAAKAQGKEVWIPEGDFTVSDGGNIYVNGVTISGAGMWHSTLKGVYFMVRGGNNWFHDFAVFGDVTQRVDRFTQCAIETSAGGGNRFENLWMEHVKCGFWVKGADGMTIKNCRIRNTVADGINLTGGTKNSTVEHCDLRNTGDDSIALNSERNQNCTGNTVKNNTVRSPYHANGIAVYGGGDNVVQDNLVFDTVAYGGGINISSNFNPTDFHGTTNVKGNVLVRTGSAATTSERGKNQGAIWLVAWQKDVSGIAFSGNRLIDCVYDGITIDGNGNNKISGVTFQDDLIEGADGWGIRVFDGALGGASFAGVKISDASRGTLSASSGFTVTKSRGNNW
jgi:parallel beta-helix repeat protein